MLGTDLKFYTSVGKGLKLKVRKFWGLIPTFEKVTGEKLVGDFFAPLPLPPSWTGLSGYVANSDNEIKYVWFQPDGKAEQNKFIQRKQTYAFSHMHITVYCMVISKSLWHLIVLLYFSLFISIKLIFYRKVW